MTIDELPQPRPEDVALFQQAFQAWNSGNQAGAIEPVRERASQGEAWAAALLSWLLMQQGYPALDESIDWALTAARRGFAGQLGPIYNNVIGNAGSYPQLAARLPEILQYGAPWTAVDPVGNAWTVIANGNATLAVQILMLPMPPFPHPELQTAVLLEQATANVRKTDDATAAVQAQRGTFEDTVQQALESIERERSEVETSARQAGLLVTKITSDATDARFTQDAERNKKESRGAWYTGLAVLAGAAVVAVWPVILRYLDRTVSYSGFENIALHVVSTAALGAVAGVLLARARSRDHAAQRANDLSTAMGTMIAYSNQISDPEERQRFMTVMGQMILQAHLNADAKRAPSDDSLTGMAALMSAIIKPSPISGPQAGS